MAFWLGRSPSTYYHYWVAKSALLFTLRWFTYRVGGRSELLLAGQGRGLSQAPVQPGPSTRPAGRQAGGWAAPAQQARLACLILLMQGPGPAPSTANKGTA